MCARALSRALSVFLSLSLSLALVLALTSEVLTDLRALSLSPPPPPPSRARPVSLSLSRSHFRSAHGPARRNPWAICPLFSSEARWHRSCTSACQSASAIAWPARVDARPSEDSTREIIEPHCSYLGKDETVSPVRCDETTDETGAGFESNRFKLPARVLWTRLISKAAKEVLPAEADSIFRSCSPFFGLPKNGKSRPFH